MKVGTRHPVSADEAYLVAMKEVCGGYTKPLLRKLKSEGILVLKGISPEFKQRLWSALSGKITTQSTGDCFYIQLKEEVHHEG